MSGLYLKFKLNGVYTSKTYHVIGIECDWNGTMDKIYKVVDDKPKEVGKEYITFPYQYILVHQFEDSMFDEVITANDIKEKYQWARKLTL